MRSRSPGAVVGALALALLGALAAPARAQSRPTPERIATWIGEEIGLDEEQRARLSEIVRWVLAQRDALEEEIEAGRLDPGQVRARRAALREELRTRLSDALPPQLAERVPAERLLTPSPPLTLRAGLEVTGVAPTRLSGGPGRFSLLQEQVSLSLLAPLWPGSAAFASLRGGPVLFGFERALGLDPVRGNPLRLASAAQLTLGAQLALSERWSVLLTGSLGYSAEDGARIDDAVTGGTISGVSYRFDERLSLGIGLLVRTQLEDRVRVFPIPLIDLTLDLADGLQLSLGSRGGVRLIYTPTPALQLSTGFGIGGAAGTADTRLDRRGYAPRGVLRSRRFPLDVRLEWTPLGPRALTIELELGVFVYQKLELVDARGRRLSDAHAEPAPYFTCGVSWAF